MQTINDVDELGSKFELLVLSLQARLGRFPTEEEVINFINGDKDTRLAIWNQTPTNA